MQHSNQQYHLDQEKLLNKKRKIIKIFQLQILEINYLKKERNYKRKNNKWLFNIKNKRKNYHHFNQEDLKQELEINQHILKVDLNKKIKIKYLKNYF